METVFHQADVGVPGLASLLKLGGVNSFFGELSRDLGIEIHGCWHRHLSALFRLSSVSDGEWICDGAYEILRHRGFGRCP